MTKGSIMPPYKWLIETDLDYSQVQSRIDAMAMLGVPYGDAVVRGEQMARDQAATIAADLEKQGGPAGLADKEVIAMIAYLQRLGTDINAPPPAEGQTVTAEK